jgi:hypothetical protein
MIKYRTRFGEISAREIVSETEKYVFFRDVFGNTQKQSKASVWSTWHDSWEDAHRFLVIEAKQQVTEMQVSLGCAKGSLGLIEDMRRPEEVKK